MKKGDKDTKAKPSATEIAVAKIKKERRLMFKKPRKGHIETGKTSN